MNAEVFDGDGDARRWRAAQYAALGDPTRLLIAEALVMTDLTPSGTPTTAFGPWRSKKASR